MGAINASSVKLHINPDASQTAFTSAGLHRVTETTSVTLNLDTNLIDVTTKDNSGRADYIGGLKSGTIDFDGLIDFAEDTDVNLEDLFTAKSNRRTISWRITDEDDNGGGTDNGGNRYEGIGIITALNVEAPIEDAATFNGTITIKGDIKKFDTDEATA